MAAQWLPYGRDGDGNQLYYNTLTNQLSTNPSAEKTPQGEYQGFVNSQGHTGHMYKMPDGSYQINGKPVTANGSPLTPAMASQWLSGADMAGKQSAAKNASGGGILGVSDLMKNPLAQAIAAGYGAYSLAGGAGLFGNSAVPGWVSAEGGAGYAGGMAADAAGIGGAGAGWTSGYDLAGGGAINGTGAEWIPAEGGAGYAGGMAADAGALSGSGAGLDAWELGMSGGAPAEATGGAGALAGTPYAGLGGASGAASIAQKVINGTATAKEVAAATTAAASAGKSLGDWAKIVLPLAGAAAGGIGANAKPAGTTTTTQDIPDWLKPYVTGNLDAAQAYAKANPQDNSLLAPASAELKKTINGDYINSNPTNAFYGGGGQAQPSAASVFPGASMIAGQPMQGAMNQGSPRDAARINQQIGGYGIGSILPQGVGGSPQQGIDAPIDTSSWAEMGQRGQLPLTSGPQAVGGLNQAVPASQNPRSLGVAGQSAGFNQNDPSTFAPGLQPGYQPQDTPRLSADQMYAQYGGGMDRASWDAAMGQEMSAFGGQQSQPSQQSGGAMGYTNPALRTIDAGANGAFSGRNPADPAYAAAAFYSNPSLANMRAGSSWANVGLNPADAGFRAGQNFSNEGMGYLSPFASGANVGKNPSDQYYKNAANYTNSSMDYLRPTASGSFLNSNPYIDAMYAKARDAVGAGVDSRFTKAGRYGSGAHQGVLGTTFGNLATDIYGQNYAQERQNMLSAGNSLISADQAQQAARLAGAQGLGSNYANDITNQLGAASTIGNLSTAQQAARLAATTGLSGNYNTDQSLRYNYGNAALAGDQAQQASRLAGIAGVSNNYNADAARQLDYANSNLSGNTAQQAARLSAASQLSNNYNTARAAQIAAAGAAPGFTADAAASPYSAFNTFGNLTKGLGVSQTSSPYFTNPTAGALSGALAGYGLSKAFG